MSLRFRISLIITVVIVLFSLVTAKIVLDDMRSSIREEMEAGTKVTQHRSSTAASSFPHRRSRPVSCSRSCKA